MREDNKSMAGFILITNDSQGRNIINSIVVEGKKRIFSSSKYYLEAVLNIKFMEDKIYYEDQNYVLIIDGVVLNKASLVSKSDLEWPEYVLSLYRKYGDEFISKLSGSFVGVLINKTKNEYMIFADPLGSKPLYYSKHGNTIIAATEYPWIVEYFKKINAKISINTESAYMLLSIGFTIENNTIIDGIYRLMPGFYAKIHEDQIRQTQYFILDNDMEERKSISEYVDGLEYYFKKSVGMQFEKDKEYGYKHLVSLSGGLDSRMTSMVAHEMGFQDQLNITFSQSNYLDQTIAQHIATDLGHDWLFQALDNGHLLYDIDKALSITGGNAMFYGVAHSNSMFEKINFTEYGLLHGGALGDAALSSYASLKDNKREYSLFDGAYSSTLVRKIKNRSFVMDYRNKELFMLYNRGLVGQSYGLSAIYNYTEAFSPCYDLELLKYMLSIPHHIRGAHKLYIRWILEKHPGAAKYKWAKIDNFIGAPSISLLGRKLYYNQIPVIIKNKVLSFGGYSSTVMNSKHHMNPIDYWYHNNIKLKNYLDNYYQSYINMIIDKELQQDMKNNYENGNGLEKVQVLTLLSAAKNYLA